jgi:hypothetical protein
MPVPKRASAEIPGPRPANGIWDPCLSSKNGKNSPDLYCNMLLSMAAPVGSPALALARLNDHLSCLPLHPA